MAEKYCIPFTINGITKEVVNTTSIRVCDLAFVLWYNIVKKRKCEDDMIMNIKCLAVNIFYGAKRMPLSGYADVDNAIVNLCKNAGNLF